MLPDMFIGHSQGKVRLLCDDCGEEIAARQEYVTLKNGEAKNFFCLTCAEKAIRPISIFYSDYL